MRLSPKIFKVRKNQKVLVIQLITIILELVSKKSRKKKMKWHKLAQCLRQLNALIGVLNKLLRQHKIELLLQLAILLSRQIYTLRIMSRQFLNHLTQPETNFTSSMKKISNIRSAKGFIKIWAKNRSSKRLKLKRHF